MSERHIELIMPAGQTLMVHVVGAGKPLVLLHGFPLDATIWQPCLPALVAAGYQVLTPDLRGFGQSSEITQPVSVADLAADIEQMRRVLIGSDKYILGGLSLGGYVAFEVWSHYRDSLRALILSNTKPQADNEEARQARLVMADKAMQESTWSAVSPMLNKLLSQQTRDQDPATTKMIQTMMSSVRPTTIAAIQRAMAERRDFTSQLGAIDVPSLIITGQHDPISPPEDNQQWGSHIPRNRLEIVPNAAHLPSVENPEVFCQRVIEFAQGL